jgi:hypothetical protein
MCAGDRQRAVLGLPVLVHLLVYRTVRVDQGASGNRADDEPNTVKEEAAPPLNFLHCRQALLQLLQVTDGCFSPRFLGTTQKP